MCIRDRYAAGLFNLSEKQEKTQAKQTLRKAEKLLAEHPTAAKILEETFHVTIEEFTQWAKLRTCLF